MEDFASGREIILEVLKNMRLQGEELLYSTIVPTSYEIYLHPDDYQRLEGVLPQVVAQAKRALTDELGRINRSTSVANRVRSLLKRPILPSERAGGEWDVRILADADEELARGDIHVYSTMALAETGAYAGNLTKRIFTSRLGGRAETHEVPAQAPDRAAPLATLTYEDENGPQTYRVDRPHLVVGRGGPGYWVDLKLATVPDVSREHIRVRYDEETRRFYIKDLSTLGTTVNGAAIPSSIEVVGEEKRDRNIEVPLPPVAVIGLAGAVFLHFKSVGGA